MSRYRIIPIAALTDGSMHRCEIDGHAILLCRVADRVYAVDDICPHENVSLSLGSLHGHRLRCPLHGSEFDVRDGRVLDEPAEHDLGCHAVSLEDGDLYVSL